MKTSTSILIVDDDDNDLQLTVAALNGQMPPTKIHVAHDGVQALDFLHCRGEYQDRPAVHPSVILLDLQMPRANGLDVLRDIKASAALKVIPVVVFSSSPREVDVRQSYELGANAYVVKPMDYGKFVEIVQHIRKFWFGCNLLPPVNGG